MTYHFDLGLLRTDPAGFDEQLARRGLPPRSAELLDLDASRRASQTAVDISRSQIKRLSGEIGQLIKAGRDASDLRAQVAEQKDQLAHCEEALRADQRLLDEALLSLPNQLDHSVPEGLTEASNVEVKTWGHVNESTVARPHWEVVDLGHDLAGQMSGARYSILQGSVARLHRALGQMMLDQHVQAGYREVLPPTIVRAPALLGTGQLPKFGEDLFQVSGDQSSYLIPTAEVPLTNMVANQILEPGVTHRFVALTQCYRSEAGSAGRDTRGLLRQHEFSKVELVSICEPLQSSAEHDLMITRAESILELLDLPYRRVLLCGGDVGFGARKTWDLEVWMPGQKAYREISSVSNCGDFQARRMNARYRSAGQTTYAHTLNGSGLAVGRTLAALVENYQGDHDVEIPCALRSYLGGASLLSDLE